MIKEKHFPLLASWTLLTLGYKTKEVGKRLMLKKTKIIFIEKTHVLKKNPYLKLQDFCLSVPKDLANH